MRTTAFHIVILVLVMMVVPVSARDRGQGVEVGERSYLRTLLPAEKIEKIGAAEYRQLITKASKKGRVLPDDDDQVTRVRGIVDRLLPFASTFNERALDWDWDVNVIKSKSINAFCMPGGKIAVYTGVLDRLALSDDETAMIVGHEIAHALREHARERAAKGMLTNLGAAALSVFVGEGAGSLARMGGGLLTLKFSRDDETESDLIGMELAARAGFDPRSAISLWQKMGEAAKGQPLEFLSTHPSGETRIAIIEENLDDVMPLYEAAR